MHQQFGLHLQGWQIVIASLCQDGVHLVQRTCVLAQQLVVGCGNEVVITEDIEIVHMGILLCFNDIGLGLIRHLLSHIHFYVIAAQKPQTAVGREGSFLLLALFDQLIGFCQGFLYIFMVLQLQITFDDVGHELEFIGVTRILLLALQLHTFLERLDGLYIAECLHIDKTDSLVRGYQAVGVVQILGQQI